VKSHIGSVADESFQENSPIISDIWRILPVFFISHQRIFLKVPEYVVGTQLVEFFFNSGPLISYIPAFASVKIVKQTFFSGFFFILVLVLNLNNKFF
jgi:hypothetical protein